MNIGEFTKIFKEETIFSETDVRTKIALPIFEMLGFPSPNRAEEYPVYGYAGREPLNAKSADIMLFLSSEHNEHRTNSSENRKWVENNSLIVVELKKPTESVKATEGQAQFYSRWTKSLYYIITNGLNFAAYKLENYFEDTLIFNYTIDELISNWPKVLSNISYNKILSETEEIKKAKPLSDENLYQRYSLAYLSECEKVLEKYIRRDIIKEIAGGNSINTQELIDTKLSSIIVSEVGGGKTILLHQIGLELIRATLGDPNKPIPIYIPARLWGKSYTDILLAIINELEPFVDGINSSFVESEIKIGKYVLLIDGLDEVRNNITELHQQLIKYSKYENVQIIVTCRKHRYFDELTTFQIYELPLLSDTEMSEITSLWLGSDSFATSYRIKSELKELMHIPLFLVMVLKTMASKTSYKLPDNKGDLYFSFVEQLINECINKRHLTDENIDTSIYKSILKKYAYNTFLDINLETDSFFNEVSLQECPLISSNEVRNDLNKIGIMKNTFDGIEFLHQSFKEFFAAWYLIEKSNEELLKFVIHYNTDQSYTDVFIMLVGLLKNQAKQNTVLDYLQEDNFRLFMLCLKSRYNYNDNIYDNLSKLDVENFFKQILLSYEGIIESFFKDIKERFEPWVGINGDISGIECCIKGIYDTSTHTIDLKLDIMNQLTEPKITIDFASTEATMSFIDNQGMQHSVPVISFSSSDGYYSYRLMDAFYSIDAAREVAVDIIKKQLKNILDKRLLLLSEDEYMACEYIENGLKKISGYSDVIQEELNVNCKNISLYTHTLDDVLLIMEKLKDIKYISRYHYHREQLNCFLVYFLLRKMKDKGINKDDCLLPKEDIPWETLPKGRNYIWDPYTDKQVGERIRLLYDFYQISYRKLIESCFSALKDDMEFYAIGPVKYEIKFYRNKDHSGMMHSGGGLSVNYEPIEERNNWTTTVLMTNEREDETFDEEKVDNIRKKLMLLGRNHKNFSYGQSMVLSLIFDKNVLREKVYKRIEDDFKRLFGDF